MIVLVAAALLCALPATASAQGWTPYDRPAQYGEVVESDVPITMSDGIVLRADVHRPDAPGRFPVLVTQTPYGKGGALAGANSYLVQRGYVHVVVDVRGTGSSAGQWDSFGPNEQRDGKEVVEWAAEQAWSDGKVGTLGPSYMAITQITTAAQHPKGLKAMFTIVPMGDSYRDITMSGGQVNTAFIPLWLGLVTGAGLVPPRYAASGSPDDLRTSLTTLLQHATGVANFQASTVLDSSTGGDLAYDGPFWKTRSPLELVDRIDVPDFVVGGLHDIFQRGEPMVYERLKRRVTTRLLIGPWTHLTGSSGDGLPRDGVPSLSQIELRWFDRYLKGIDTRIEAIPQVTKYVWGAERYETDADWPSPKLDPSRLYLRAGGGLSPDAPTGDEAPETFLQHPLSGICSQSTSQWTAGIAEPIPCTTDDRLNEAGEVTYTTPPMERDLRIDGPLLANLWVTTTARDAVTSVKVTDVAPDGSSKELTGGWLAASFRKVDDAKSRFVRGKLLQPYHPFTRESVEPVEADKPMELAVEVFPTSAVIQKGHRLRVAVGPGDFPHQLPPAPQALAELGGAVEILHDAGHPSALTLPTIGTTCAAKAKTRSAKTHAVARLGHGPRRRAAEDRRRVKRQRAAALRRATGRSKLRTAGGGCPSLPIPDMIRG
jgi:putative CocE/NonD family hydrolase